MYNGNATLKIRSDILSNKDLDYIDRVVWGYIYTFQKHPALQDAISSKFLQSITHYDEKVVEESLSKMILLNYIKSKPEETLEETIYEVI